MSEAWNEDEWVAAFLDGRLDERERAEMLARLATDDEAYEHFAATAAILREAEKTEGVLLGVAMGEDQEVAPSGSVGGDAPAGADEGVVPLRSRKRPPILIWLALAAGIAGIALAGSALWPRASSAYPVRLAARLEHPDRRLPAGWTDHRPWSSPRGDDQGAALTPEEKAALAVRAGADLVDLSVAVRGRDTVRTRLLGQRIASRYDPRSVQIADRAGAAPKRLLPLVEQATDRIATRLGREPLELGAWTEAARLAAARRDAAFFGDPGTGPMLDRLAAAHPAARAAVERVRLLAAADPSQWSALAATLHVLAQKIASG